MNKLKNESDRDNIRNGLCDSAPRYISDFKRIRRLLSCTRRAVDEYGLIDDGDRIAVGLSGGKDSIALLCALINLSVFIRRGLSLSESLLI